MGDHGTNRMEPFFLGLFVLVSACGGQDGAGDTSEAAPDIPADQAIRTADPYARGYTDDDFPRVQELAPGVYSYEQLRSAGEEKFTTVSLFVVTGDGVLVADGQGNVEETERMIEHIAEITDEPIRTVVVASDHGDHTAGNSAFPANVAFLAHPTSALALESTAANARDGAPPVRLATQLVEDRTIIDMGDKEIHVLFLGRAHTGGDLVVYLPEEKVMFMSETYLYRVFPAMRTAFPTEWVDMIEAAQAMDVDIYVPGHGFVDHPSILAEELEIYQDALRAVIAEAHRLRDEGYDLGEAQERATFGDLETWSLRSSQGDTALRQIYAEMDGELPADGR